MFTAYRLTTVLLILAAAARSASAAEPYKPDNGPHAVTSLLADWKDAGRSTASQNVTVPVKVYYPKNVAGLKEPLPLIIFSHGLGGSRETYQAWGEHWASHGYIVVHPSHVGSDSAVISGGRAGMQSAISAQSSRRRTGDVSFIIDQMEKASAGTIADAALAPFKGKVDVKHVGMAGHSFGAQTTLVIAGQRAGIGALQYSAAEPRVTAAVAMSPQPPMLGDPKAAFADMKVPVFHVTGTHDDAPEWLTDTKAAERRVPYDCSPLAGTRLVIYKGATHMTFAMGTEPGALTTRVRQVLNPGPNTPVQEANIHTLVKESTTAYWDAQLKGDAKAQAWLDHDFAKVMGEAGTFEMRKRQ